MNIYNLKQLGRNTPVAIVYKTGTVFAGLFCEVASNGFAYAVTDPTGVPRAISEDAEVYPIANAHWFELVFHEFCGSRPGLRDTIKPMVSDDYKERFKAEYMQLAIRQKRLKAFISRIDVKGPIGEKHDCPLYLLKMQYQAMAMYREILLERARIEKVDLTMPQPFPIWDWWKAIDEMDE